MSPKCTLVYTPDSVVCLFALQPVVVDSHWLFTAACSFPEHPSQSHPHCMCTAWDMEQEVCVQASKMQLGESLLLSLAQNTDLFIDLALTVQH